MVCLFVLFVVGLSVYLVDSLFVLLFCEQASLFVCVVGSVGWLFTVFIFVHVFVCLIVLRCVSCDGALCFFMFVCFCCFPSFVSLSVWFVCLFASFVSFVLFLRLPVLPVSFVRTLFCMCRFL